MGGGTMLAGAATHVRYTKRPQNQGGRKGKKGNSSPESMALLPAKLSASSLSLNETPKQNAAKSTRRGSAGPVGLAAGSAEPGPSNNNFLMVPENEQPGLGRKRSGSVPVIRYTLAVSWSLKPDYVRALKVTWDRLCDVPRANCRGILGIMERVFEKFEAKNRQVKEIFYQAAFVDSMADTHARRHSSDKSIATLRDHIHFFVSLISQVIHSLEKPPTDIFEHIDKIGSYHYHMKRYGFRAQMWDTLGVCLVDAIVVQDCVRGYPEACKAWTLMVAALIDRLRSARKGAPVSLRRSSLFSQTELVQRCPSPTPRCPSFSGKHVPRRGSVARRGSAAEKRNGSPKSVSPLMQLKLEKRLALEQEMNKETNKVKSDPVPTPPNPPLPARPSARSESQPAGPRHRKEPLNEVPAEILEVRRLEAMRERMPDGQSRMPRRESSASLSKYIEPEVGGRQGSRRTDGAEDVDSEIGEVRSEALRRDSAVRSAEESRTARRSVEEFGKGPLVRAGRARDIHDPLATPRKEPKSSPIRQLLFWSPKRTNKVLERERSSLPSSPKRGPRLRAGSRLSTIGGFHLNLWERASVALGFK